jgi:hypothetical protein
MKFCSKSGLYAEVLLPIYEIDWLESEEIL